ncbi:MAG: amidohydrolase family protein [Patescibacteria group bacterium]
MHDILIKNGIIVDGTGQKQYGGDLAINDKKITEIGDLSGDKAHHVIDASGKIVAPGFIDISNRSDTRCRLFKDLQLESLLHQGITTIIGGNSGASLAPIYNEEMFKNMRKWSDVSSFNVNWQSMEDFLETIEKQKLSVNFGTFVGYGTLRRGLVGDEERKLDEEEKISMEKHLTESFNQGALGVSTGLIYSHERGIETEELIEVAKITAKNDKLYVAHLRDEGEDLLSSIEEVIRIKKETGVKMHVSHLKAESKEHWSDMVEAIEKLEKAGIIFDVYPYTFSTTVLYTLLPDWVSDGGRRMMLERLKNKTLRKQVIDEMESKGRDLSKAVVAYTMNSGYFSGKSFAEIAKLQEKSVNDAVINVLLASEGQVNIFLDSMSKENIVRGLKSDNSVVSSNGVGFTIEKRNEQMEHPRSFGAFARVFCQHVVGSETLSVETAVHKSSGKVAQELNIEERGFLKKGFIADIVIFDLENFKDHSDMERPFQYSTGVESLVVNGQVVLKYGKYIGVRSGGIIKK